MSWLKVEACGSTSTHPLQAQYKWRQGSSKYSPSILPHVVKWEASAIQDVMAVQCHKHSFICNRCCPYISFSRVMHLHRIPWFRTTLLYVIAIALFFLYGQSKFYRDPGSIFFDEDRAYERRYSAYRQAEIDEFQSQVSRRDHQPRAVQGVEPSIRASFLSVKRQGSQYLPVSNILDDSVA